MSKKRTVMLLEAFARQVLPIAKGFSRLGYDVVTVNQTRFDLGHVTRYAKYRVLLPELTVDAVEALISQYGVDLVVPLSDESADFLSRHKERLSDHAAIAVNDRVVFDKAFDKWQTMRYCMEQGIPCPRTVLSPACAEDVETLGYPFVVKPRSACGSIGFYVIHNRLELDQYLLKEPQAFSDSLFQEYIPQTGAQYNVHLFLDEQSEIKTMMTTEKVRWFPVSGGAATLCVENDLPDVSDLCARLLKGLGWIGYCDVDLILDPRDGIPKIIEVNARISANVKICSASRIDIARQLDECYRHQPVTSYREYLRGRRLRCIHTDILWFLKSKDRFRSDPSWFSIKNTTDQIGDIRDPLPFFVFSFQSLFKLRRELKKRRRTL